MNARRLLSTTLLALTFAVTTTSCVTKMSGDERERRLEIYRETCGAYLSMNEWERAEDQALRGLALDGEDFDLRLYLGRALLNKGTIDDILKAEYTLEGLDADGDFRVPLSLAEVLERKGVSYEQAAVAVASGERATPAADPQIRAAELQATARKSFLRSLKLFEDALDLQPNDTEVLNGLVRVTALLGNYEDSLAWGAAVVSITTSDRLFWRSQLERPNISPQEEERMWSNINRLRELEQAVHLHSATLLNSKLGRSDDAVRELDAIVAVNPDVPEVHSQRAQLLVKLGRYEDAIAAIDDYLRLAGLPFDNPDIQRAYRIRRDCETALVRAGD